MSGKLLYPAGAHLWLTRKFYPWDEGDEITLAEDWHAGDESGATTVGDPFTMRVTADAVTATPPADPSAVDQRAIADLYAKLDNWQKQGHTTVQIAAIRRHLDTRGTR